MRTPAFLISLILTTISFRLSSQDVTAERMNETEDAETSVALYPLIRNDVRPRMATEEEKEAHAKEMRLSFEEKVEATLQRNRGEGVRSGLDGYVVGGIGVEEGVSSTGARTYTISMPVAPAIGFTPEISLQYNSQGGEGYAGYGWDLTGLSRITLVNKTKYFNGVVSPASIGDSDVVFSLDGECLVENTDSLTRDSFPLRTAFSRILVSRELNEGGFVRGFTAKYPDGSTAVFGGTNDAYHQLVSYPVVEKTDIGGNRITYHYNYDIYNNPRISRIRYGIFPGSDAHCAEFVFEEEQRPGGSYPEAYYAGSAKDYPYLLKGICSLNGTDTLSRYTLTHTYKDRTYLLTQMDCSSGTASLPPVRFSYPAEVTPEGYGTLSLSGSQAISSSFSSGNLVYRRGKFLASYPGDGLLIYPLFDNYKIIESSLSGIRFGSGYDADQSILFVSNLSTTGTVDTSIKAESGFQTMEAVDVDGDGIDELVKVNIVSTTQYYSVYKISVYKCGENDTPELLSSRQVVFAGVVKVGSIYSPYRRQFFWGDYLGNGKTQLLAVAYNSNGYSCSQTCYAALIDLDSLTKISESVVFSFPLGDDKNVVSNDIDSDSRTELCHATSDGMDIYRLRQNTSNQTFSLEKHVQGITSGNISSVSLHTDFNGDGYMDIATPPASGSSAWHIYVYNGNDFLTRTVYADSYSSSKKYMFLDLNRDGFPDLVEINGSALGTYLNNNGRSLGSYASSASTVSNCRGVVPCNVVRGYSSSSFIVVDGFLIDEFQYSLNSQQSRKVVQFTDSFGNTGINEFKYIPDHSWYWTDGGVTVSDYFGFAQQAIPLYVLYGDYSPSRTAVYNYYDGVIHNYGLGFCGFSKVKKWDYGEATHFTVRTYDPRRMGVLKSSEQSLGSYFGDAYATLTNSYDSTLTSFGHYVPRLSRSVSTDNLTGITTTTDITYDGYDYPVRTRTAKRIGSGRAILQTQTRSYSHFNSPSRYLLGLVAEESTVMDNGQDTTMSWERRSVVVYDTLARPVNRKDYVGLYGTEIVEQEDPSHPGFIQIVHIDRRADKLEKDTKWTYSIYGNISSEKVARYGAAEFVGPSYSYVQEMRYLHSSSDEIGVSTLYGGQDKFGNPTYALRDYIQLSQYTYDGFGKLTCRTNPDGTVEMTVRAWGGKGAYTITKTHTGRPDEIVHYDSMGREIRRGEKLFDGRWTFVDREYDRNGRVKRESLPFCGDTATVWKCYSYDAYGRLTGISEPSGRVCSWSYSGTGVTQVTDGATLTRWTDAAGRLIRTNDGEGNVSFSLRDDGQPSLITVQYAASTSISYDDYGRRIQIDDPSAGTVTDTYVNSSNGTSRLTRSGNNGSVTTWRDKYGRVTKITKSPGLSISTYTYGVRGLLSSVVTSDGVSRTYAYDSNDRMVNVLDSVSGGVWLRKTMTYGANGRLSSMKYTAKAGDITTESYTYTNGHHTGTSLPDGTVIFRLDSVDVSGRPVKIQTGGISREYGYTEYGLPSFLSLGNGSAAYYEYEFSPQTGNLLMRKDSLSGRTEHFGYDDRNRLVSMDGRSITYQQYKGNISEISQVGTMYYMDTDDPYKMTGWIPYTPGFGPSQEYSVSYSQDDLPKTLSRGTTSAELTYGTDRDRVRMVVKDGVDTLLVRHYAGGVYEKDESSQGDIERLYLGGDAYSARMVYVKTGSGGWTLYNIGRDYLGSVTDILTSSCSPVAKYRYDPWGRVYDATSGQDASGLLFLGRGYTGHEHLPWFDLINANARLYDPLFARFLSPDPYVQAPDLPLDYNRYSYCLNNPLKYRDESGEFFVLDSWLVGLFGGGIKRANQMALNDLRIWGGLFVSDPNKNFGERVWEVVSRFTWQLPQTILGFFAAHAFNTFRLVGGISSVEYLHGATVLSTRKDGFGAFTLGSYITGDNDLIASDFNRLFQHEFGHYLQSQAFGPLWSFVFGVESVYSAIKNSPGKHKLFYTEQDANARSFLYYRKYYPDIKWSFEDNPIKGYNPSLSHYNKINLGAINMAIISLNYIIE